MEDSYLDKMEEEGVPMATTVEDVIRMKIDMLRDVLDEIEYLYSSDFNSLTRKDKAEALKDVRTSIKDVSRNENELNRLMVKMFDHAYYNAMD